MTGTQRDDALRQMLNERRAALQNDVQTHLRRGRQEGPAEGRDDLELSDDEIRGDLSFALLQMKSETIAQLDAALRRLDAGKYGDCVACEQPIASQRLRALPFAVRCQPCAERHERRLAGIPIGVKRSPLSAAPGHDRG
jgi:DnaK suppressor protein